MADATTILKTKNTDVLKFNLINDSVNLMLNDSFKGRYKYIKIIGSNDAEFKIKLLNPDRKIRTYQNNISLSVVEEGLKLINEVELNNYIAGVTEAEAGSRTTLEFYKVQSILARTFALAHINKHVNEGFSLCDQVHCQAYFGKPKDSNICSAINLTQNLVVVDENLNLIIAAFHSNCGGQTANSEDVWGAKTSYLRSISDSFSLKMPNSKWERRMLTDDWLSYLKLKHNIPIEKENIRQAALKFNQESRKIYLECNNTKIPLKNVRQDLQLKSTFFNILPLGKDSILFIGRGYGHGLGLCQEGAIKMGKLGYNYTQILNFYYQNTQLIDLHKLNFFKDE